MGGSFVRWSEENHLKLNIVKTKELVIDFRRSRKPPTLITIQGEEVEIVDSNKFLGIHINNRLNWKDNTLCTGTTRCIQEGSEPHVLPAEAQVL